MINKWVRVNENTDIHLGWKGDQRGNSFINFGSIFDNCFINAYYLPSSDNQLLCTPFMAFKNEKFPIILFVLISHRRKKGTLFPESFSLYNTLRSKLSFKSIKVPLSPPSIATHFHGSYAHFWFDNFLPTSLGDF